MDNNEINNLDPEDIGLKQIMGNRFHDATKPMVEPISTKPTSTTQTKKVEQKVMDKAVDAQWEPVRPEPNWMDRLKDCVKWVGIFGFLSCLIFYWKQTGLMAESIAVPSMCICTALAGWGAGRNIRGNR
jgi:hypothetical protein